MIIGKLHTIITVRRTNHMQGQWNVPPKNTVIISSFLFGIVFVENILFVRYSNIIIASI